MAISYAWTFPTLDVVYSEDGFSNVVQRVHYVYTGTDGEYTATTYNVVSLDPPGQPFISYDDLTPQIVTGWVEGALGADQLEAMNLSLANQIEAQKNPTGGALAPPWTASAE